VLSGREQLQHERGTVHHLAPAILIRTAADPAAPEVHGFLERVAHVIRARARASRRRWPRHLRVHRRNRRPGGLRVPPIVSGNHCEIDALQRGRSSGEGQTVPLSPSRVSRPPVWTIASNEIARHIGIHSNQFAFGARAIGTPFDASHRRRTTNTAGRPTFRITPPGCAASGRR
jgi:hypothetical protein